MTFRRKCMDYINHYSSPLGGITLASDGTYLVGLWFDNQRYFAAGLNSPYITKNLAIFDQTKEWLDIYFSKQEPDFTPKLLMRATPFRKEVWELLLSIPYGQTQSYGELANILAHKKGISQMSAQAVGGAIGHNMISLIIPCHRVLSSNGKLTGYAAGLDKKSKLLQLEGIDASFTKGNFLS